MNIQSLRAPIHIISPSASHGEEGEVVRKTKKAKRCTKDDYTKQGLRRSNTLQRYNNSINCNGNILGVLPNHIISDVLFGYLDQTPKQLSTIKSVCKLFLNMSRDSITTLDLKPDITKAAGLDVHKSLTYNMINQFTNLREVDLSFCSTFDDTQLQLLVPMRSKLRVLKLRGTMISDRGVSSFFEYDQCIRWYKAHVELIEGDGALEGEQSNAKQIVEHETCLSLPLEVLDLSQTQASDKITNKSLLAVMYTCRELKQLSLSMCAEINDDFIESMHIFFTKLTALDVSMTSITSRGCFHLARLPSLLEVDISACSNLCGQSIAALVEGKVLDEYINDMNDEQYLMQKLGKTNEISNLSQLTSISARFAKGIDESVLDKLGTLAPNLKCLDLRHYRGNDLKTGFLSPLKMSLRNLMRNGVSVAFSRSKDSDNNDTAI